MSLKEIHQDLFTFDFLDKIGENENFALAHCVSQDLKIELNQITPFNYTGI